MHGDDFADVLLFAQVLLGHNGRVNCLLYPNNEHPRYDVAHLVSGSVDFSVCLWDIYTGALLHRFGSHAGEITRLYVPPPGCTPRVQHCVCGIASDNSVSLLSLKVYLLIIRLIDYIVINNIAEGAALRHARLPPPLPCGDHQVAPPRRLPNRRLQRRLLLHLAGGWQLLIRTTEHNALGTIRWTYIHGACGNLR